MRLNKIKKFKILNVGCGKETYGTHFVDLYPTRKEVIKCDVNKQKLPFPSNFFDVVYSKNLFEHLINPEFALNEMKRVLKTKRETCYNNRLCPFLGICCWKNTFRWL